MIFNKPAKSSEDLFNLLVGRGLKVNVKDKNEIKKDLESIIN